MKKLFLLTLTILVLCCSNDNDSSPDYTVIASLLDKWWHPYSCCSSDFYIHSDGRYEQRDPESNEITDTGNWVLEDENIPSIKIDYDEGTQQTLPTLWLQFFDIQEHTINVYYSSDGINFNPVDIYQDTDSEF